MIWAPRPLRRQHFLSRLKNISHEISCEIEKFLTKSLRIFLRNSWEIFEWPQYKLSSVSVRLQWNQRKVVTISKEIALKYFQFRRNFFQQLHLRKSFSTSIRAAHNLRKWNKIYTFPGKFVWRNSVLKGVWTRYLKRLKYTNNCVYMARLSVKMSSEISREIHAKKSHFQKGLNSEMLDLKWLKYYANAFPWWMLQIPGKFPGKFMRNRKIRTNFVRIF